MRGTAAFQPLTLCIVWWCWLSLTVLAATKSLEWDIGYTTANPDAQFERRVIGVNGQWPPPAIELDYGDTLVLDVTNSLGDVVTGLHAHGLFQNNTNYYDGPVGVVQWCVLAQE
jgi:iron transport multicopper oxidase